MTKIIGKRVQNGKFQRGGERLVDSLHKGRGILMDPFGGHDSRGADATEETTLHTRYHTASRQRSPTSIGIEKVNANLPAAAFIDAQRGSREHQTHRNLDRFMGLLSNQGCFGLIRG